MKCPVCGKENMRVTCWQTNAVEFTIDPNGKLIELTREDAGDGLYKFDLQCPECQSFWGPDEDGETFEVFDGPNLETMIRWVGDPLPRLPQGPIDEDEVDERLGDPDWEDDPGPDTWGDDAQRESERQIPFEQDDAYLNDVYDGLEL